VPVNWQVAIAVGVGLAASVEDLARRRISNWIPASAFLAGLVYQSVENGWRGTGAAVLGAMSGFGVFLIFYLLGGMGGGDVKLMAGFGALLGAGRLLEAALWTAGIGGLLAAAVLIVRELRRRIRKAQGASDSIPYAPAIAIGVWLSLVPKA
jgi:prepilin peptidase CpaA